MLVFDTKSQGTGSIPNIAANGVIGAAATTVDLYSSVVLAQTTPNIVATLPVPTGLPAWGLQFIVHNVGNAGITLQDLYIRPGSRGIYTWLNSRWTAETDSQRPYAYRANFSRESNIWPSGQTVFTPSTTVPPLSNTTTPPNKIPDTVQALSLTDGNWAPTLVLPTITDASQPITIFTNATFTTSIQPEGTTLGAPLMLSSGEYVRFVPTSTGWQWVPPASTGVPIQVEHHRLNLGDFPSGTSFNGRTYPVAAGWVPFVSGVTVTAPTIGTAHGVNFRVTTGGLWELYADVSGAVESWKIDVVFQLYHGMEVTRYGTFT